VCRCLSTSACCSATSQTTRLRLHAGTPELARHVRRWRAAALVPRRGRGARDAGGSAVARHARARIRRARRARAHLVHPGRGRPPPRGDQAGRKRRQRMEGAAGPPVRERAAHARLRRRDPLIPASVRHRRHRAVQPAGVQKGRHVVERRHGRRRGVQDVLRPRGHAPLRPTRPAAAPPRQHGRRGHGDGTASMAACVSSVLVFMAAFSIGLGPMAGTYSAEIMPLRLRAQGASLGNAVNRLTCGLVSMTFISLADWITMPGCFFLYAGVATTAFVFFVQAVPRDQGAELGGHGRFVCQVILPSVTSIPVTNAAIFSAVL
jgi:hypothetical protein